MGIEKYSGTILFLCVWCVLIIILTIDIYFRFKRRSSIFYNNVRNQVISSTVTLPPIIATISVILPPQPQLERVIEIGSDSDEVATTSSVDEEKVREITQSCSDCAICLDNFDEQLNYDGGVTTLRVLRRCGHRFHTYCINQWFLNGHHTCPICRVSITYDVLA
ncbi:RING-H2 finger protein ATL13-like [Spinacia oleracea]|uniref:RING-H2 finger protein ATL13-like n=1 Tax=Spinacia oleracea TaxID=3562 RepID=A0ABM3RNK3_SPIOL|nr:RING-H2 finger protein ATL13-like [Spinacia oleracea]